MGEPVDRFHVVLYQPEIPQNTGNIGRTCVAAGAKLWLVQPLGFRLDHVHLRRAGLDYWEHLQYELLDSWSAVTDQFPVEKLWLFTKFGRTHYTEAVFRPGDALVFGNESSGLPPSVREGLAHRTLYISMWPAARSLNLAVAVGIGLYEALRQTHAWPTVRDGGRPRTDERSACVDWEFDNESVGC